MIRHLTAAVWTVVLAVGVVCIVLTTVAHAAPTPAQSSHVRTLPACPTDEGADGQANRGCVWDARAQGNGQGRSFVIRRDADAAHGTLIYVSHTRAHALLFGADA